MLDDSVICLFVWHHSSLCVCHLTSCFLNVMNIPVFTCQEINADGEMELKKEEGSCYAWLEETEVPENSKMDGIEYLGPQVDESRC